MNDAERSQWIDNDEGLYNWWRSTRQSKTAFIRENRADIDAVTGNVTSGRQPAHYLAYPHDGACHCARCYRARLGER